MLENKLQKADYIFMKPHGKDYIATLKECHELTLASAFSAAADVAARKYGVPILKLPLELIRSMAASDPKVVESFEAWQRAVHAAERQDVASDDLSDLAVLAGYVGLDGQPMTVGEAQATAQCRLDGAESSIKKLVDAISSGDRDDREFWRGSILETATLIRVEVGSTLTMLGDIVAVAGKKDRVRRLLECSKTMREDTRSIIDLAKAHLGMY